MSGKDGGERESKPSLLRGVALLVIAGIVAMPLATLGLMGVAAGGNDLWFPLVMSLLALIPVGMGTRGVAELLDAFAPSKRKSE